MLRALLLCVCSGPLVAQTVVVIQNNQQVRAESINDTIKEREQEYWAERVGFRITKDNDYELYAVLRGLGQAAQHSDANSLDTQTLTQLGLDSLNYYNDPTALPKFPGQDTATTALTSAASIENPWVGVAAPAVLDMMSANLATQLEDLYPIDRTQLRAQFLSEGSGSLQHLWEQADKDPRLKAAINALVDKKYHGITMDDNQIGSPDPDLQTYKAAVQSLENPALSADEFRQAFKAFTDEQNRKFKTLDSALKLFASTNATKAQKEMELKTFQRTIDDERAIFYLASTAGGLVDPTTGRVISGIGTAYTKIAEASGLYRLNQISSLRLTADVVSAGLLLASMLGNNGPTADEMILDQLHQLSIQIDKFRQEMHQRFDRVDQALSRMYVDLIANFNEVNKNVALARQGIITLQVQLQKLQGELGELDRRVQSYTQGLSSQLSSIDQLLCSPTARQGGDYNPTADQVLACELSYANTGSSTAKNAVWNNLSSEYSDDGLRAQLDRPIEQNINFLWGLAATRFHWQPAPSFTVVNPVVWSGNSDSYVRLISRSRPIATNMGPTDQLISAGRELQTAVGVLGHSQSSGTTRTLFDHLLPYFIDRFKKAELDVSALEKVYENQKAAGYDVWGDANQQKTSSTSDQWTFTTAPGATPLDVIPGLAPCSDVPSTLANTQIGVPNQFAKLIPFPFRMAQELGLGQVKTCYSVTSGWYGQVNVTFSGWLVVEIRSTFSLNPPPEDSRTKKAKKNHKTNVASEQAPQVLVISRRSARAVDWAYDCDARTPKDQGPRGHMIMTGLCVDRHSRLHAFPDNEMAEELQTVWPALQGNFVATASAEINDATTVSKDFELIKEKVEVALGAHRARIRSEVVDAIRGQTGDKDFVAEEKLAAIKDFSDLEGLKALIDAYAGLVLSYSIETDEKLASGLGDLSLGNWAVEITRMGSKKTLVSSPQTQQAFSRVFFPLAVTARTSRLQTVLDKHLLLGAEPYVLLETTLQNLKAVRVVQIAQSLAPDHPCFAGKSNAFIEGTEIGESVQISGYSDQTALTSIRVTVVPAPNSPSIAKTDIVVGNNDLLMSGVIEPKNDGQANSEKITVTFPANGMVFHELRDGVVRVCNDFGAERKDWTAESILVEVSRGGGTFDTFRFLRNVHFPNGKASSVTFWGDSKNHFLKTKFVATSH